MKLPEKNRNFFKICLEKSKFLVKFAWKNRIIFPRIHDPRISNQIDASVRLSRDLYNTCIQTPHEICTMYKKALTYDLNSFAYFAAVKCTTRCPDLECREM